MQLLNNYFSMGAKPTKVENTEVIKDELPNKTVTAILGKSQSGKSS